jgi:hypothetical protein
MTEFLHFSAADEVGNGCYLAAETARRAAGRTEPDLHLIKQVEQVTTSFWKLGDARCFD